MAIYCQLLLLPDDHTHQPSRSQGRLYIHDVPEYMAQLVSPDTNHLLAFPI